MKNPRWCWSWCSTCTAPPVSRDDVMSHEGIFNRCQRKPKERQETRTKRIRERFKNEVCFYTSENRVPTVVSLGVVAPALFAHFKSSRNRFRRFETSSRVNSFRFAFLEFVPISLPVFAFASCTSALNIVILFRKREKILFPLCLLRAGRERDAFAVPTHA